MGADPDDFAFRFFGPGDRPDGPGLSGLSVPGQKERPGGQADHDEYRLSVRVPAFGVFGQGGVAVRVSGRAYS